MIINTKPIMQHRKLFYFKLLVLTQYNVILLVFQVAYFYNAFQDSCASRLLSCLASKLMTSKGSIGGFITLPISRAAGGATSL